VQARVCVIRPDKYQEQRRNKGHTIHDATWRASRPSTGHKSGWTGMAGTQAHNSTGDATASSRDASTDTKKTPEAVSYSGK